jgi:hypothetical protein
MAHERHLREVYRQCLIVVGDRLHGLIIGATEGAVPLGWVESSGGKIGRHFLAVGLYYPGEFEGASASSLPALDHPQIEKMRGELGRAVESARGALDRNRALLALLASDSFPAGLEAGMGVSPPRVPKRL